ncbi:MAG: hypothetical protein IPN42_00280 [Methylococcaceae bacterium]|nr:hypothetical protein [Methylococcaceae bacterium]
MTQENLPVQSVKSLINTSLTAILLAMAVLFVAVLPAEYGIDPTGLGAKMGLTALSHAGRNTTPSSTENCAPTQQSQTQSSPEIKSIIPVNELQPLDAAKQIQWKDSVKIVIPPKKGLEYKFGMNKGAVLEFSWHTDGGLIYFDFHGEPKGATNGYFKSYLEKMESESSGALTAPFEGIHGWYWENETSRPVTIDLKTTGTYQVLGVMH